MQFITVLIVIGVIIVLNFVKLNNAKGNLKIVVIAVRLMSIVVIAAVALIYIYHRSSKKQNLFGEPKEDVSEKTFIGEWFFHLNYEIGQEKAIYHFNENHRFFELRKSNNSSKSDSIYGTWKYDSEKKLLHINYSDGSRVYEVYGYDGDKILAETIETIIQHGGDNAYFQRQDKIDFVSTNDVATLKAGDFVGNWNYEFYSDDLYKGSITFYKNGTLICSDGKGTWSFDEKNQLLTETINGIEIYKYVTSHDSKNIAFEEGLILRRKK